MLREYGETIPAFVHPGPAARREAANATRKKTVNPPLVHPPTSLLGRVTMGTAP
jgi:hypothetical protein